MPRKIRSEYPGAIYHVMSRGNRREELQRLGWKESDLEGQPKSAAGKWALGSRLKRETTVLLKWIATRV